ncbi:MAG: hypothetical protein IPG45_14010 [Deltaproteobacteria bacterium]|jgi:hypothetical protein|nr:hypothetical protein [Deltaproteobacteria bacterium]
MIAAQKLDTRVVHRYIHKEQLTQEQYDKVLAELPDLAEQGDFVDYETRFHEEAKAERDADDGSDD